MSDLFDCTCVGLTILDVLGRPIDAIPDGGPTTLIEEIRMTPAGTAAGPAVIARKLGLRSRLVGARGDDELGEALARGLEARGVDTSLVQVLPGVRTSTTLLTIRSGGDRPAFHAPGASLLLEIADEDLDRVASTRFLHLGGVGTMLKMDGEPSARLLARAKELGATVTCDLIAPSQRTLPALEAALPHVDYFMPTLDEAVELAGASDALEAAAFFVERGAGACIFKDGSAGSLFVRDGRAVRVPAFRVDAVDTTGCGDSYCAGFIAALHHGLDEIEAARVASAVAAQVATGLGSDAGVVGWDETLLSMKELPVRG